MTLSHRPELGAGGEAMLRVASGAHLQPATAEEEAAWEQELLWGWQNVFSPCRIAFLTVITL